VPGGRHATVLLDIANTGVARGKVYAARERGERLPDGWAIDASGLPTNDPQAALDGLILPMSGHKGYAISFMMDVLSGVLTGSACGADVVGPYVPDKRSGCGHLVIALNIAAIMPLERFTQRIDKLITHSQELPHRTRPRDSHSRRDRESVCHSGFRHGRSPGKDGR
jgi:LDH2 family malate/lactate/ureidoglycolate dehydrogenase